MISVNK